MQTNTRMNEHWSPQTNDIVKPISLDVSSITGTLPTNMSNDSIPIRVGTAVAVIGLCSVPAITSFVLQLKKKEPRQNFYEDGDGKSTPEAIAAYSARVPKAVILCLAAVGFGCSMAAVLNPIHVASHGIDVEDWLIEAAWVCAGLSDLNMCDLSF